MKKKLIGDLFIKLKWKEMERNGKGGAMGLELDCLSMHFNARA